MRRSTLCILALLLAFLGTASAERAAPRAKQPASAHVVRHDTPWRAVPGSKLEMRAVEYDGSTNGVLKIEVRNRTRTQLAFSSQGLYFIPDGDPDDAPQRLGAVGAQQIAVAPGATLEVALDVFCIDSHRSSPTPQNRFAVAAERLPQELARTIEKRADEAVTAAKAAGAAAPRPAAKDQIQSEVWKSRDAKWIKLHGEGKQEASK